MAPVPVVSTLPPGPPEAGASTSEIVVEGNFTEDTLTFGTTMTKTQGGKPVLRTTHDLSGKRDGDCPA